MNENTADIIVAALNACSNKLPTPSRVYGVYYYSALSLFTFYDKVDSFKINNFTFFENGAMNELLNYGKTHYDHIIKEIFSMEYVCFILTPVPELTIKIDLTEKYPDEYPIINFIRANNWNQMQKNTFLERTTDLFDNNLGSISIIHEFFDKMNNIIEEINCIEIKETSPKRLKINENRSIFVETKQKFEMRKIIIKDIKDTQYSAPPIIEKYNFQLTESNILSLSLFQPNRKSYFYRFGPINFLSHTTDYKAIELTKNKLYRVTVLGFDLSPFKNSFPDVFDSIKEEIKKSLFKHRRMQKFVTSSYIFIDIMETKVDNYCIIILKKDFEESMVTNDYFTYKNFIEILSILNPDNKNSEDPKIIGYVKSMLDILNDFHNREIFHGYFDVNKIFLSKTDSSVLLYDSYYDTLLNEKIPSIIKHGIEIGNDKEVQFNLKKFEDHFMEEDVLNLGLFTFFLFANNYDSAKLNFFDCNQSQKKERFEYVTENLKTISSHSLRNFIKSCITHIEERATIENLLVSEFICENKFDLIENKRKTETEVDTNSPKDYMKFCPRLRTEFSIRSKLGKGGFGTVWRVYRYIDKSYYALKLCKIKGPKAISETLCLSKLNHPNIVRYYNCWIEDKQDIDAFLGVEDEERSANKTSKNNKKLDIPRPTYLCIQMELCQNPSLWDYLQNFRTKGLPVPRQKILLEIVSALAYIHKKGIIHRDLKPPNIFFDSNDCVKIGDFGLSRMFHDVEDLNDEKAIEGENKSLTLNIGTRLYAAPEIFRKKLSDTTLDMQKVYTSKVDVYSFGIIYFELCYPCGTQMERALAIENIRQDIPKFPSEFSKLVNKEEMNLIQKLISHDPENRPSTSDLEFILKKVFKKQFINVEEYKKIVSHSPFFEKMIEIIFSHDLPSSKKSISYDSLVHDMCVKPESNEYFEKLEKINLTRNFAKIIAGLYSAADFPIPTLMPKNLLEQNENFIDMRTEFNWYLLDRSGVIVSLPYTNRTQLAKHVATTTEQIVFLTRSSIDKCFLQVMDPFAIQELHELNFDMIWQNNWSKIISPILPYCELIGFAYQLLSYFVPSSSSSSSSFSSYSSSLSSASEITFYMTSTAILESIIEFIHLPSDILKNLVKFLAEHDYKFLTEMDAFWIDASFQFDGMNNTKKELLFELMQIRECNIKLFKESIFRVMSREKGKANVNKFFKAKVLPFIDQMESISNIVRQTYFDFGAKTNTQADFRYSIGFISKNSFFYNDLIVNVVVRKNKRPYMIGYGGKYDKLIKSFENNSSFGKNGIGISFDHQDLCDLIGTNQSKSVVYNKEFISSCQKYFQNMSNLFFSSNNSNELTSTRLSTNDVLIYSAVSSNSGGNVLIPVCSLANELRKIGLRVLLLPEVTCEEFTHIKNSDFTKTESNLRTLLSKMNFNFIISIDTSRLKGIQYDCFYRSFRSPSKNDSSQFEWNLKTFETCKSLLIYVNDKMNETFNKTICFRDLNEPIKEDSSPSIETSLPSNLQIEIFNVDKRKKHHQKEIINIINNKIKNMAFFNLNVFTVENFKIMAFDLSINRIETITETIQISKVQSINQKDKSNKLQTLINNYTEIVCSKFQSNRNRIQECVQEICNYFANKHSTSTPYFLIIFSICDDYQYRMMCH